VAGRDADAAAAVSTAGSKVGALCDAVVVARQLCLGMPNADNLAAAHNLEPA
jgi:hypothetical protein